MNSKTPQLSPADWARLKDVLHGALSLDPAQRPAFISASGLAPELKTEVDSLLSNADAVDDFLSVPAGAFAHGLLDGHLNEHNRVGERVGVYELISVLGRGGMGTVFLAERCDEKFDQRVAIKVLKRELNTADLRAAFKREIQIQSKLVHPNIATIIDAGTTDDELPYIVMEYIEGVPIDQFCVNAGLSLNEVLKLFNKVCDAVAFAHRNLIIHRDLKPGNIVVNGNGVPKLLDFGIAELISADGIEKNGRASVLGLTPNYSSPEQRTGKIVGTPADIYSLGIVLFKLLTRKLPVDPSKNGSNGASSSSLSPAVFPRTDLPDDLESIIQKATASDPDGRYQTADQLSADIWRFIDGEPVQARPNTFGYRFKKFVLRRRLAFAAFVIIVISLVGGTAVALWQARVARSQAAAAKTEQAKSEKISKFMFRVLSYANPNWYAEGSKSKGQARVLDVMYELGDKIDEEFVNEPDVAAELHYRFSEAMLSHPDGKERGRSHILRALELRKSFYGDWHELVAKDMAYVYWSSKTEKADEDIANFAKAITMLRSTNPANRNLPFMLEDYGYRLFDDTKPERAEAFYRHASDRQDVSRYELADRYFVEMLELLRLHYKEDENPIIFNKCALAMTKAKIGQFDDAQNYFNVCKAAIDAMPVKRENWVKRLEMAESLLQNRPR